MKEEKINDRNNGNKELQKEDVKNNTGHQLVKQDAHHTDQQEGNMNNGELGANLSSGDEKTGTA